MTVTAWGELSQKLSGGTLAKNIVAGQRAWRSADVSHLWWSLHGHCGECSNTFTLNAVCEWKTTFSHRTKWSRCTRLW